MGEYFLQQKMCIDEILRIKTRVFLQTYRMSNEHDFQHMKVQNNDLNNKSSGKLPYRKIEHTGRMV